MKGKWRRHFCKECQHLPVCTSGVQHHGVHSSNEKQVYFFVITRFSTTLGSRPTAYKSHEQQSYPQVTRNREVFGTAFSGLLGGRAVSFPLSYVLLCMSFLLLLEKDEKQKFSLSINHGGTRLSRARMRKVEGREGRGRSEVIYQCGTFVWFVALSAFLAGYV